MFSKRQLETLKRLQILEHRIEKVRIWIPKFFIKRSKTYLPLVNALCQKFISNKKKPHENSIFSWRISKSKSQQQ